MMILGESDIPFIFKDILQKFCKYFFIKHLAFLKIYSHITPFSHFETIYVSNH